MPKYLLVLLLAFGVWANELNVLIKMIPAQEKHFREKIVKSFADKKGCKVQVSVFKDNWDLTEKVGQAEASVDVAKVPMGMAHVLVNKNLVKPLVQVVDATELKKIAKQYFLMNLAKVNGQVYYIPRKFETRIMVFRKSKVKEAVAGWNGFQKEIEDRLKTARDQGLPTGYTLSPDPSQWNYLDLFVVGYVWAHKEYDGKKVGRVVHRGKEYSGTALGLMDRCFQLGAKGQDVLNIKSKQFFEVLRWESLYASQGVYPKAMWEQGWSGGDIWKAFGRGDVFLSFLTQIDCYFLHGTDQEGMQGFLKDPDDLGFSLMPQGMTVAGDLLGKRSISTGGWLWGIGVHSKNPGLALSFIEHITNYENQVAECDLFGIIPVRKDILGSVNILFSEPWKEQVSKTSLGQLKKNGRTALPYTGNLNEVEKQYIRVWKRVVAASINGFLSPNAMQGFFE